MTFGYPVALGEEDWRNSFTAANVLSSLIQKWWVLAASVLVSCLVTTQIFLAQRGNELWQVIAVVNLAESQAPIITSSYVLDLAARKGNLNKDLRSKVYVTPVGFFKQALHFRADSPAAATALAHAVIGALPVALSLPEPVARRYQEEIDMLEAVLPGYDAAIRREGALIRCLLGDIPDLRPQDTAPCNEDPAVVEADIRPFDQVHYYLALLDSYRNAQARIVELKQSLRDPMEGLVQLAPGAPKKLMGARSVTNWTIAALFGLGIGAAAILMQEALRAMRRNNPGGRYDRLLATLPRWASN